MDKRFAPQKQNNHCKTIDFDLRKRQTLATRFIYPASVFLRSPVRSEHEDQLSRRHCLLDCLLGSWGSLVWCDFWQTMAEARRHHRGASPEHAAPGDALHRKFSDWPAYRIRARATLRL